VPVVVTVHSMWGRWAQLAAALGGRRAPGRIVVSAVSGVAAQAVSHGLGGREVLVLGNGIDVESWRVTPLPRPAGQVLAVAVMRLAPRKRAVPLLRAVAAARARLAGVDLRLLVIGDGPQRGALESWLRRHGGTGWVELAGRLTPAQIREIYSGADFFVSAAELESFGIAALEARSAGLPVIAKACTGVGEFVESGAGGLLVGDDDELAAAIVTLAGEADLRQRMAEHNRAVPPPSGWPAVLEACFELYEKAISSGSG
jgi:glycosyltransferase involved in cell wall biosynthesis